MYEVWGEGGGTIPWGGGVATRDTEPYIYKYIYNPVGQRPGLTQPFATAKFSLAFRTCIYNQHFHAQNAASMARAPSSLVV